MRELGNSSLAAVATIHFRTHLRQEPFEITVYDEMGGATILEVDASDRIITVKALFRSQTQLPTSRQELIFNGTRLENKRTLAYYHIAPKDALQMVLVKMAAAGGNKKRRVDLEADENQGDEGEEKDGDGETNVADRYGNTVTEQLRKFKEKTAFAKSNQDAAIQKMVSRAVDIVDGKISMRGIFEKVPLDQLQELQTNLAHYAKAKSPRFFMCCLFKHCFGEELEMLTGLRMQMDAAKQGLMGALAVSYLNTYRVWFEKGASPAANDLTEAIVEKRVALRAAAPAASGSRGFFGGAWI